MHPYRHTPGSASVKCPHRLLPPLSQQPRIYVFYGLRPVVVPRTSLCPKVEQFGVVAITPGEGDEVFWACPPGFGGRALLPRLPPGSPSPVFACRYGGSRPCGNSPSRRKNGSPQ